MRKLEEGGGKRRKSPLRHMQLTGHMLYLGSVAMSMLFVCTM